MASTSEHADTYIRTLARVNPPPPTADAARADYWSRESARWEERARQEGRRAWEWRGMALYATSAAIFLLGQLRGTDWMLALGVVVVICTVVVQSRGTRW